MYSPCSSSSSLHVPEEGEVRLDIFWGPLVHRRHSAVRLGAAPIVLEEQVLRHADLLLSGVAGRVCRGPHLMSGAGQRFSTRNQSLNPETVAGWFDRGFRSGGSRNPPTRSNLR